jgi:hypothetical protein
MVTPAFLNAGFGDPLPREDLALIKSLGYAGIRQDVPTVSVAAALVDNILAADLMGIFVVPVKDESACQEIAHAVSVRAMQLGLARAVVLEAGNEEDLSGKRWSRDPLGWARLVADVALIAAAHSDTLRVVSGGVSSLSGSAMDWLRRSRVRELPVGIGYHQYRSTPPSEPLDGYASREAEFAALRRAAGHRAVWMTESGWHTAKRTEGHWPCKRTWSYTDAQVADFLREEMRLNAEADAECFVTYQWNDGLDPANDQDCFGIRRVDGTLKPQAKVLLT